MLFCLSLFPLQRSIRLLLIITQSYPSISSVRPHPPSISIPIENTTCPIIFNQHFYQDFIHTHSICVVQQRNTKFENDGTILELAIWPFGNAEHTNLTSHSKPVLRPKTSTSKTNQTFPLLKGFLLLFSRESQTKHSINSRLFLLCLKIPGKETKTGS